MIWEVVLACLNTVQVLGLVLIAYRQAQVKKTLNGHLEAAPQPPPLSRSSGDN